ncbi:hypothetical protein OHA61_10200 [Streptomyces sp. NBC_00885]|uniref:hypothetical protein n=1 Tax=Streptomyces sp. NBC_00885 TaxID=2975857 RepID=UPI00386EB3BF|nr:hypothetical protein OHA61_10200 [Streptomyces sp. NBC_00885]
MTAADRHLRTLARQQLGHSRTASSEAYIRADTTALTKYTESAELVAARRLGHLRVESSSELYIGADTTAAIEYAASGAITVVGTTQPADEDKETP